MRHAKSSWKTDELADHDRPLNARGQRDAPRIGRLLRAQDLEPDRVLCSTAKRARKTATEVVEGSGYDSPVELLEELYLASPSTHIDVLRRQIGEPKLTSTFGNPDRQKNRRRSVPSTLRACR